MNLRNFVKSSSLWSWDQSITIGVESVKGDEPLPGSLSERDVQHLAKEILLLQSDHQVFLS